jgi:hypothetical protein
MEGLVNDVWISEWKGKLITNWQRHSKQRIARVLQSNCLEINCSLGDKNSKELRYDAPPPPPPAAEKLNDSVGDKIT